MLNIDGAIAAAVVDFASGMLLAGGGSLAVDLEIAAAGNIEVMRAKTKTIKMLNLQNIIDGILISLGLNIIWFAHWANTTVLFLYIVLDKSKSNLARRGLVETYRHSGWFATQKTGFKASFLLPIIYKIL